MNILAFGIPQPTTGDRGSVFFPALEQVIQRLASHDHDGVNTALISGGSIQAATVSVPSGSWVLDTTGRYKQTVTFPAGRTVDNSMIEVRDVASSQVVYTAVVKVASNQVDVYTNDNTVNFELVLK